MKIFLGYIFVSLYLSACLFLCKILSKKITNPFYIRKLMHCLIFFEWVIMSHFWGASIHTVIACCLGCMAVLLFNRLQIIKYATASDGKLHGTLHYAIIASCLSIVTYFLPQYFIHFGITMCCLSLGDGFAGIVGSLFGPNGKKFYRDKTILGTLTCFITVLCVLILFKNIYQLNIFTISIIFIALVISVAELLSPHFYDNVVISLVGFILLIIFTEFDFPYHLTYSLFAIPLIAVFVMAKKALTWGGIISALISSLIIIGGMGDFAFFLLTVFFLGASICDNIKKKHKKKLLRSIHDFSSSRSAGQVLACSFFPCLASMAYLCNHSSIWLFVYTATVAESLGDTVASEVGVLSKNPPYDIFRRQRVSNGLSGGMSLLGTVSSLLAIFLICLFYVLRCKTTITVYAFVVLIAFTGMIVDSLLGSLVQRKYLCPQCGSITERTIHCDTQTRLYSGIGFVGNTSVNFFSNMVTFVVAIIIAIYLKL